MKQGQTNIYETKKTKSSAITPFQPRPRNRRAPETQDYDRITADLSLGLPARGREEIVQLLNQILADTIALRDLYKKSHWQVSGLTFYQLHLLFDNHYEEQSGLVDKIAKRVQLLGGISIAMAHDVAEMTGIERPPRGREEVPVQISRLLDAHELVIKEVRSATDRAIELNDDGSNYLLVSDVLRANEFQAWFLSEHLVAMPLVFAK